MDNLLETLNSTEVFIVRAEENLKKLKQIQIDGILPRLQPLIEKLNKTNFDIHKFKEKTLKILLEIWQLLGKGNYKIDKDHQIYIISTWMYLYNGKGCYIGPTTYNSFMKEFGERFYPMCDEIIGEIKKYFDGIPERQRVQSKEISVIKKLANELLKI